MKSGINPMITVLVPIVSIVERSANKLYNYLILNDLITRLTLPINKMLVITKSIAPILV